LKPTVPGIASIHLISTSSFLSSTSDESTEFRPEDRISEPVEGQVVLSKIELWADLGKGSILVALSNSTSPYKDRLDEPELVVSIIDADSNGSPDFLFSANYGRYLTLTRDGKVWKIIKVDSLAKPCGGC